MKILLFLSLSLRQQWPPKASVPLMWRLWLAPISNLLQRWMLRTTLILLSSHGLMVISPVICCKPALFWIWPCNLVVLTPSCDHHHRGWPGFINLTRLILSLLLKGTSELLSWRLTAEWTSDNLMCSSSAWTSCLLPVLLHPQLNACRLPRQFAFLSVLFCL